MSRLPLLRVVTMAMVLAVGVHASAAPVGKARGAGSLIEWQLSVQGYDRVEVRVSTPDGDVLTREFKGGQTPSLRLQDLGTDLLDGTYTYELRVYQKVSASVAAKLKAARASNDDAAAKKIMKEAGLTDSALSGAFTVLNQSIVNTDAIEAGAASLQPSADSLRSGDGAVQSNLQGPGKVAANVQVIADDLVVQGSECVGIDCTSTESFGFDTIRLKENNLRIKFEDTSTSAGFPTNDWQLTANDSASGGASKFSIEDVTGAKVPVTVTAGAATNSIFVDSTGRVGFRTATPVLDLHVQTSNTPAMRLEQSNAGGFTAQTWDIAGNEANFFVRDVTGGSRLPFRIRPGAPTSSIDIAASGDVGIGTASPDQALHVEAADDANTISLVENTNATGLAAAGVLQARADIAVTSLIAHGSGRTIARFGQTLGGFSEMLNAAGDGLIVGTIGATPLILGTNSTARMTIASTGAITVPGNFTVTGVKNFATVDPANPKNALYYTALEGPEAGTYFRGTAQTVDGEVIIELPGYFARLTESDRMTVQLTPIGAPGQLYVAEKSPSRIVVKIAAASADVQFDYLVQGVRKGYLDYQVERAGAFPVEP